MAFIFSVLKRRAQVHNTSLTTFHSLLLPGLCWLAGWLAGRCMASKLKSLTAPGSHGDAMATPAALGERVVATSTLASFLSYLCFAHAGSGAADSELAGWLAPAMH